MNKVRDVKGNLTTDTEEIQKLMMRCFKNLCSAKLENPKEKNNFLNVNHLPKLNQDQISNLNRTVMLSEIKSRI